MTHNEEADRVEVVVRRVRPDGAIEEKVCGTVDLDEMSNFDLETKEGFLRDFDKYEHKMLTIREDMVQTATEFVTDDMKKKSRGTPRKKG